MKAWHPLPGRNRLNPRHNFRKVQPATPQSNRPAARRVRTNRKYKMFRPRRLAPPPPRLFQRNSNRSPHPRRKSVPHRDAILGWPAAGQKRFATGEPGFETMFRILRSRGNHVGKALVAGHFCKFHAVWHCYGIGLAFPICAEKAQKLFLHYVA
jgi:hypothetical protein